MADARFGSLVDTFLEHLVRNRGRSERTAESYRLALSRLATFADPADPFTLGPDELAAFAGPWLHKQGIQARARRPYVAAVRMFFRWAAAARHVPRDPARTLPYPKAGRRLPGVITLANAEKLMWSPDFHTLTGVRDAAILAILAGVGLRASGVVRINESHVRQDSLDGELRTFLRVVEKGDRERIVPLPEETQLLLRMYLEHPDLQAIDRALDDGDRVLFVSLANRNIRPDQYHGERRRLSRKAVFDLVRRHGARAGIPEDQLHPHALRHLYGTELAESEVDMVLRQRLMGHASPASTAIYDHTAVRRMVRAVDRANPMAKMRTPVGEILARLRPSKKAPTDAA